jgi:hypothetical protein
MSKRSTVPAYRRHKASNRAYVFMNGRRIYLGRFGSEESKAEYRRILNELDSSPTRGVASSMPLKPTSDLTIAELGLAYVDHTDAYYRKPNGEPTTEAALVERVVDMVVHLYGHTLVNEFGPLALKAVRAGMIEKGWRRLTINGNIGRVVRMFKWAAENELVGGNALHALRSVSGLRYGRSSAPESSPVLPVSAKTIEATLPHLSPHRPRLRTPVRYSTGWLYAYVLWSPSQALRAATEYSSVCRLPEPTRTHGILPSLESCQSSRGEICRAFAASRGRKANG